MEQRKISRREFLRGSVLTVAGVALLLVGCKGGETEQAGKKKIPDLAQDLDSVHAELNLDERRYGSVVMRTPNHSSIVVRYPYELIDIDQSTFEKQLAAVYRIVHDPEAFRNLSGYEDAYHVEEFRTDSEIVIHEGTPTAAIGEYINYQSPAVTYNWVEGPKLSEIAVNNYGNIGIEVDGIEINTSILIEAAHQVNKPLSNPSFKAKANDPEIENTMHTEFVGNSIGFAVKFYWENKQRFSSIMQAYQAYVSFYSDKKILLPSEKYLPVGILRFDMFQALISEVPAIKMAE